MNKASLLVLTLIATLLVCACAARRKAVKAPQEEYPYQNAIEYRKATQKPVVTDKKGFPLPPKPTDEQNAALIFPGNYTPETGRGRAVLQKLLQGDYYFQASVSYDKSASTFEGVCYQIDSKLICPIDYDIDEDFNPVEAYIELEQINPGELKLAAYYTLPGLFGQGLPELYRRSATPARKPGSFVKPLGQAQAPVVAPARVAPRATTQAPPASPALAPASPTTAPSTPVISPTPAMPQTSSPNLAAPQIQETAPAVAPASETIQAPQSTLTAPEIPAAPQVTETAPALAPASPTSAPSTPVISPTPAMPQTSSPNLAAPQIQETAPAVAPASEPIQTPQSALTAPEIPSAPQVEAQTGQ